MKKSLSALLALALTLSLAACGGKKGPAEPAHTDLTYSARELAAALILSQPDRPEFYFVTEADTVFSAYAALYLGAELADEVVSGAICYPVGPLASEIAVFELGEGSAKAAPAPMADYLTTRVAAFFGYAPEEAALAEAGQVRILGQYAVLFILKDQDAADAALDAALSASPPAPAPLESCATPLATLEEPDDEPDDPAPTQPASTKPAPTEPAPTEPTPTEPVGTEAAPTQPPQTEPVPTEPPQTAPPQTEPAPTEPAPTEPDEYDHDKVLAALRGERDSASLMPKNRAVYDAVTRIFSEILTPDMTDYDRELAVNDYLVFHAEYDPAELSSGPVGVPDPDNDNPYGLLVKGVGICLGYASTFQLMMDVLDIECLTVHGFAHDREEHAWNLVNLDGDWYAVDVTWNDPVFTGWQPDRATRLRYAHLYFNVTGAYLRQTDHQWTQDVPEAEGTKYAYHA